MNPHPSRVLQGIAANLLSEILPSIQAPFGQQLVGIAAMLNMMVAEEFERAADRLVTENRAVREVLSAGRELLGESTPPAVTEAIDAPPAATLVVTDLQRENDILRAALIDLHAAVERAQGEVARALETRIWEELIESTRRRQFSVRP